MIQSNKMLLGNIVKTVNIFSGDRSTSLRHTINTKDFKYLFLHVTFNDFKYVSGTKNRFGIRRDETLSYPDFEDMVSPITQERSKYIYQNEGDVGIKQTYRIDAQTYDMLYLLFDIQHIVNMKVDYTLSQNRDEFDVKSDGVLFETDKLICTKNRFQISDCYNAIKMLYTSTRITVTDTAVADSTYVVNLSESFPTLSQFRRVYIIPFDVKGENTRRNYRLAVQTMDGKIYYQSIENRKTFKESAFWDIPDTNQRLATNNQSLALTEPTLYRYDPSLPAKCYVLPNSEEFPLQKMHGSVRYNRFNGTVFFEFLGGMCRTAKAVYWGTYGWSANFTDKRSCIFMSTDGGMNWYAKYDFTQRYPEGGFFDENAINSSLISGTYTANTLKMRKVTWTTPTGAIKEPVTKLSLGTELNVASITKAAKCIVNIPSHGIETFAVVCFKENGDAGDFKFMANANINENNIGDKLYFASKKDADNLYLYNYYGSLDNNLPCRHVHSVNETVDGVVFATGEEYPDGWVMWLKQGLKDLGIVMKAEDSFPIIRLNSTPTSIQRACGVLMGAGDNPYIIFGSDSSEISRPKITIEGRNINFSRASHGLWRARLSDIDDFSKWECILDVPEPCIYLYRHDKIIVAGFQIGGLAVSADDGQSWNYFHYQNIKQVSGVLNNNIIVDGWYTLKLK